MMLTDTTVTALLTEAGKLRDNRDYSAALDILNLLDRQAPSPRVQFDIGVNLAAMRKPEAALPYLYRAAASIPNAWSWIGYCLHGLHRYDEAIEVYKTRASQSEDTHNAIAAILYDTARWREAFEYLLTHCPEPRSPVTQQNLAFCHLGYGQWAEGWPLHRFRHKAKGPAIAASRANLVNLDQVRGHGVLVCCEEGNGDCLQFYRWIPHLAEIASEVTIWAFPALGRLFEAQNLCRVITDRNAAAALLRDGWRHTVVMDLAALFDVRPDTLPGTSGYLKVPTEIVAQRALPDVGKFRVGLCWQGSIRPSFPVEDLAPMFALAERLPVEFVSLQMPDKHRDHPRLTRVLEPDFDFLDTAAIITQLDLVISVDTAVAHLAGALGKPVWLLNRFDSCWRWGWERDFNWYDSMRIYRAPALGAWSEVIARVAKDLARL